MYLLRRRCTNLVISGWERARKRSFSSEFAGHPSRSWLFISNPELCAKSKQWESDVVVLDLEDGVPKELKATARQEFAKLLKENVVSGKFSRIFVRVNSLENYDELRNDVKYLALPQVYGFALPKVLDKSSLAEYELLVSTVEKDNNMTVGSFKFLPLIETPDAFFNANEIARGSARNVGLITGAADFMAESLSDMDSCTTATYLSNTVIACRAANILPISGVIEKIDDYIAGENHYRKMRACGFAGAVVLTPNQAIQANIAFSYSPQEIHWVQEILSGKKIIRPSLQESRQFIGPPHRAKAATIDKLIRSQKKLTEVMEVGLLHGRIPSRGLQERVEIGATYNSPHEVTVSESWRGLWDSSFLTVNRLATSAEFATMLGLPAIPLPYSLLNTLVLTLTVICFSDSARVHLGCYNSVQHKPLFPGDTVTCSYQINDARAVRSKEKSEYTVVDSTHRLFNQHDEIVYTTQKRTMFCSLEISGTRQEAESGAGSEWKQFIISQPARLMAPTNKQPCLTEGDLIIHEDYKVFGRSEVAMLAKLMKATNAHHHNIIRYSSSDILVPGPFVMAAMVSNTGSDAGDVLYEEIPIQTHINKVNPGDQLGTLTYVMSVGTLKERPDMEELTLVQLGIKNVDLKWLKETGVPKELFVGDLSKPAQYEDLCAKHCPLLYRKIACMARRKIIRLRDTNSTQY